MPTMLDKPELNKSGQSLTTSNRTITDCNISHLHRSTYRPLERSLPISLLRTREAVLQRFTPSLHKIGMSTQKWRVLRVLNAVGELPMSELAERSFIMLASLSRIVKRMIADGYIEKRRHQTDQRSYTISLTEKGQQIVTDYRPQLEEVYDDIERVFGYGKLELLFELLHELTEKCHQLHQEKDKSS